MRPLLVVMNTPADADLVAKTAWEKTPKGSKCPVTRDYTKHQRERRKQLVTELYQRKQSGETNVRIQRGHIINTLPFRQAPRAHGGEQC